MNNFREKTASDTNYVTIRDGSGCSSSVGMVGGQQYVTLSQSGCYSKSTIQHEFIHAMGFDHVQSRPDRDQYVTIHYDNIRCCEANFELLSDSWLTFGVEYDPKSFMHYHSTAFAKDYSKPTISSKVFLILQYQHTTSFG